MAKTLPLRPNLEQLKKQAKDFLKTYKDGGAGVFARIREQVPRLAEASDADMPKERFVLQDAQHVIAREYGFSTWDALVSAVKTPFEVLVQMTDREVQVLMREVDQKDLVVGLSGASEQVREKFLGNMSARVRGFITEEIGYLAPLRAEEVDEVQFRIVKQVIQLGENGQVMWPPKKVEKRNVAPAKKKPTQAEREQKERIAQTSEKTLHEMSYGEIDRFFVDLAETARSEGILALEKMGDGMADDFVKMGVQLIVDGTEPELVMDMLETWKKSLLHQQEVKYNKVIEALMAMQSGDNPRIIEHKLSVIF